MGSEYSGYLGNYLPIGKETQEGILYNSQKVVKLKERVFIQGKGIKSGYKTQNHKEAGNQY